MKKFLIGISILALSCSKNNPLKQFPVVHFPGVITGKWEAKARRYGDIAINRPNWQFFAKPERYKIQFYSDSTLSYDSSFPWKNLSPDSYRQEIIFNDSLFTLYHGTNPLRLSFKMSHDSIFLSEWFIDTYTEDLLLPYR